MLALPGVLTCSVSVTTGRATVTLSPSITAGAGPSSLEEGGGGEVRGNAGGVVVAGTRDVIRAVESLGFGAKVIDLGGDALSGVKRLQEVRKLEWLGEGGQG